MSNEVDIFISYKSEERGLAEIYRAAFIKAGYIVVSDVELSDGEDFGKAIDQMIRSARLVVVLWTQAATQSPWVISEARLAIELKTYLGVWLAERKKPFELLPVGLFDLQKHMFGKGLTDHAKAQELVGKIRARLGAPSNAAKAAEISSTVTTELFIYESVTRLNNIEAYQGYLEAYPNGRFKEKALAKIDSLSSWRTRLHAYMPSIAALSLVVAVLGFAKGFWNTSPDQAQWEAISRENEILTAQLGLGGGADARVKEAEDAQKRAEMLAQWALSQRNEALSADAQAQNAAAVKCNADGAKGVKVDGACFALDTKRIKLHSSFKGDEVLSAADLAGLKMLKGVTYISVSGHDNDFSQVFAEMPLLERVHAQDTALKNLNWLKKTPKLNTLFIGGTDITDISALRYVKQLNSLSLLNTKITKLAPARELSTLTYLALPTGEPLLRDEIQDWQRQ